MLVAYSEWHKWDLFHKTWSQLPLTDYIPSQTHTYSHTLTYTNITSSHNSPPCWRECLGLHGAHNAAHHRLIKSQWHKGGILLWSCMLAPPGSSSPSMPGSSSHTRPSCTGHLRHCDRAVWPYIPRDDIKWSINHFDQHFLVN